MKKEQRRRGLGPPPLVNTCWLSRLDAPIKEAGGGEGVPLCLVGAFRTGYLLLFNSTSKSNWMPLPLSLQRISR
jgi:hypothetical protein